MNETIAAWLASKAMVEAWKESERKEPQLAPAARRRWRGWGRVGRLGPMLRLARRGRVTRPVPAGPECDDCTCHA